MNTVTGPSPLVGSSVRRVEDASILTGRGRYVADVALPGMLHSAFARARIPHGHILEVDVAQARACRGVVAVLTGDDLVAGGVKSITVPEPTPGYRVPAFDVLTRDKIRLVGDPIALVVAESRVLAEDAAERVRVRYRELPAVDTTAAALDPSSPTVFDELETNVIYEDEQSYGTFEAAMARSDRLVSASFAAGRLCASPMETRGIVASYDPSRGELTCHSSTQGPHLVRMTVSEILGIAPQRTRVLAGDVGGSFGQKIPMIREEMAVCYASKLLGRPVRWIEDRAENLLSNAARGESIEITAAVLDDGTVLALDVDLTIDHGAYESTPPLSTFLEPMCIRALLPSALRLEGYRFRHRVVATNTPSRNSYRGPWIIESIAREGVLDAVARELDIPPEEVRRRNLLTHEDEPTALLTGPSLEGLTIRETLERAVELVDVDAVRREQARLRAQGRLLGLGVISFLEPAPGPPDYWESLGFVNPPDSCRARLEPDGCITLFTSQAPHGQGLRTTLAQVAAAELAVPFDSVSVVHGDTQVTPFVLVGTGGSRSASKASGATVGAARQLKAKILRQAAQMLDVPQADLSVRDGVVHCAGGGVEPVSLAAVAEAAVYTPVDGVSGLEVTATFNGARGGWTQSTHACVVELDRDTGFVLVQRYIVVEDCGPLINPRIADGQVRGGLAQGIGAALLEHAVFEDGHPLAATFRDYIIPTVGEVPEVEIHHVASRPLDEIGYRGVGEGGALGAPPCIMSAVNDALAPLGCAVTSFPITPSIVHRLIHEY